VVATLQPFHPTERSSYGHDMQTDYDGGAAYYVSTSFDGATPRREGRAASRAGHALPDVPDRLLLTALIYTPLTASSEGY
jgi:hypothetical protein